MSELPLPTARDWMRPPKLTLRPGDDVFAAIDRLLAAGLPTAAVLDGGQLVGIFTEKDAIRALSRLLYDATADTGAVRDHMSRDFSRCTPQMDFFRVAELFLSCNFPTLPVVDDGRLIGVVERRALLVCVHDYRQRLAASRTRDAAAAGHQADRPRGIEAQQRSAAGATREQLVRLFSRRKN
ncbi:MAG: CBS domain-containing protein [Acidobacteriota bacterium]|nr:CBS domain-containing protein [Acidobacteriota bacterium]MDH3524061.1 CBS domain-containing protein [Acidobacteriota bacterium]